MPSVTRDHADPAERRVEHRMSQISLHVVRRLVEISVTRYVVLALLAENAAVRVDHHRRVPYDVAVVRVALQDRRDDHDVVLLRDLDHEGRRRARQRVLRELVPGVLLASAEGHWHCCHCEKRLGGEGV